MCSVYEFGRGKKKPPQALTASGFGTLDENIRLIRRPDKAPVYLSNGDIRMMRWSYERPGLGDVNNTRSENFDSPMWRDSIEHRRCLHSRNRFLRVVRAKGKQTNTSFHQPGWRVAMDGWYLGEIKQPRRMLLNDYDLRKLADVPYSSSHASGANGRGAKPIPLR
ncbi:hypothetical protein NT6N_02920 [Oceaniferula spumae]|uniref:Uncharacterized protein n=1 Tax=Oceaniferula spumae TaxID=2979115 RepID=A0AAT9FGZ7_9BACT